MLPLMSLPPISQGGAMIHLHSEFFIGRSMMMETDSSSSTEDELGFIMFVKALSYLALFNWVRGCWSTPHRILPCMLHFTLVWYMLFVLFAVPEGCFASPGLCFFVGELFAAEGSLIPSWCSTLYHPNTLLCHILYLHLLRPLLLYHISIYAGVLNCSFYIQRLLVTAICANLELHHTKANKSKTN